MVCDSVEVGFAVVWVVPQIALDELIDKWLDSHGLQPHSQLCIVGKQSKRLAQGRQAGVVVQVL